MLPFIAGLFYKKAIPAMLDYQKELSALKQKQEVKNYNKFRDSSNDDPFEHYYPQKKFSYQALALHPFYFDPNTLEAAGWQKMGLREKTIATILNYISKGGKFKSAEDLKKIWGLKSDEAAQLMPWVRINNTAISSQQNSMAFAKQEKIVKPVISIDVNQADSARWESLPGIGSKLSQRIVNFRNKLGGFYSIEQVGETFGLPDSTFKFIKKQLIFNRGQEVKKLNINTASLDELKAHPYVRYHLANAIIQYRTQHGNFTSIEDIKKIMLVDDALYQKIFPYLSVN